MATTQPALHPPPETRTNDRHSTTYDPHLVRLLALHADKPWVQDSDWSRLDFMIARDLLAAGHHPEAVTDVLRLGSPNLPVRKRQLA